VTPRIQPVPRDEWPPEMRDAVAALQPPRARHESQTREGRPQALNALATFANHPDLARAWMTFNGHVLRNTTLTLRHRELLILRVAVLRNAAYEWAQHVPMGRDCGLTDDEITRIAYGPDLPYWNELDAAMLSAADELVADAAISDATWAVLADHLDTEQLLDVIFTVGAYEVIAFMFRSCRIEFDDDLLSDDR
jgi:alkylhydroperoxidase family enzyme